MNPILAAYLSGFAETRQREKDALAQKNLEEQRKVEETRYQEQLKIANEERALRRQQEDIEYQLAIHNLSQARQKEAEKTGNITGYTRQQTPAPTQELNFPEFQFQGAPMDISTPQLEQPIPEAGGTLPIIGGEGISQYTPPPFQTLPSQMTVEMPRDPTQLNEFRANAVDSILPTIYARSPEQARFEDVVLPADVKSQDAIDLAKVKAELALKQKEFEELMKTERAGIAEDAKTTRATENFERQKILLGQRISGQAGLIRLRTQLGSEKADKPSVSESARINALKDIQNNLQLAKQYLDANNGEGWKYFSDGSFAEAVPRILGDLKTSVTGGSGDPLRDNILTAFAAMYHAYGTLTSGKAITGIEKGFLDQVLVPAKTNQPKATVALKLKQLDDRLIEMIRDTPQVMKILNASKSSATPAKPAANNPFSQFAPQE